MQRTYRWSWLGAIALAVPTLAAAQDSSNPSHTVREGDTLWELARTYRGDPFLWPDIFRMNTSVVEDPHWIYPGEILRLSAGEGVAAVPAQDTPAPAAADSAMTPAAPSAESPAMAEAPATEPVPMGDAMAESPAAGNEAYEPAPASLASLTTPSPDENQSSTDLFGRRSGATTLETLKEYTNTPYRALRRSEFYSSGFLTEKQKLPFGKVYGPVAPPQIRAAARNTNAMPYSSIAVSAPKGARYQVGDTLLVVQLGREVEGYGDVVLPSGMVQVTDTANGKYLANVIAVYGPIRGGQSVLPLEKFSEPGPEKAAPISSGVRARMLGGSVRQDLKAPQMVVFLDKGSKDGVATGDLFEIRRRPETLNDGTVRVDDVMATLQIVHVGERSATARLLNVISPDIAPGTEARQVAKLP